MLLLVMCLPSHWKIESGLWSPHDILVLFLSLISLRWVLRTAYCRVHTIARGKRSGWVHVKIIWLFPAATSDLIGFLFKSIVFGKITATININRYFDGAIAIDLNFVLLLVPLLAGWQVWFSLIEKFPVRTAQFITLFARKTTHCLFLLLIGNFQVHVGLPAEVKALFIISRLRFLLFFAV